MLLCLAGAGLALWAATRTWSVELTVRPAPLPPVRDARSGGEPAALAAGAGPGRRLAGGGAVLATRGRLRRVLGALLGVLGLAVAAGGGYGLVADVGGDGEPAVAGALPARRPAGRRRAAAGRRVRGGGWPAMGARYERPARTAPQAAPAQSDPAGPPTPMAGRRTTEAWDALDRGEDPTAD